MFHAERCDFCGKCLEFCPYVGYDLKRAQGEMKELVAGGTPPIVGSCVTCASCNLVCPTRANPFDLLNERQEKTGALKIPEQAMQNFAKLHSLPTVVKKGKEGAPVLNLCIVGDMVRELLDNPLFEDLTIVEGADYFCTVGYIHLGRPSPVRKEAERFIDNLTALKYPHNFQVMHCLNHILLLSPTDNALPVGVVPQIPGQLSVQVLRMVKRKAKNGKIKISRMNKKTRNLR